MHCDFLFSFVSLHSLALNNMIFEKWTNFFKAKQMKLYNFIEYFYWNSNMKNNVGYFVYIWNMYIFSTQTLFVVLTYAFKSVNCNSISLIDLQGGKRGQILSFLQCIIQCENKKYWSRLPPCWYTFLLFLQA